MDDNTKYRMLCLYQHLVRYSSPEHPITTPQLIRVLKEEYGCQVNRNTLANDFDALDLSELTHESELIPMSNMETVTQLREEQKHMQGEHLRVVDDNVEMEPADDVEMGEDGDGDDDTEGLEGDVNKFNLWEE